MLLIFCSLKYDTIWCRLSIAQQQILEKHEALLYKPYFIPAGLPTDICGANDTDTWQKLSENDVPKEFKRAFFSAPEPFSYAEYEVIKSIASIDKIIDMKDNTLSETVQDVLQTKGGDVIINLKSSGDHNLTKYKDVIFFSITNSVADKGAAETSSEIRNLLMSGWDMIDNIRISDDETVLFMGKQNSATT